MIGRLAVALALAAAVAGCGDEEEAARGTDRSPTTRPATTEPATTDEREGQRRLRLTRVAGGLDAPVHVAFAPGEPGRAYVVEQQGRIRVVEDGRVRARPFLDISENVACCGEQGLLALAFHPDYGTNGRFYVHYTNRDGDTRVVEYRAAGGGTGAPEPVRELLAADQPYVNHNGGQLAFGPDGLLHLGLGDGGSGGDPENRAQDLSQLLGKLLRLDVDDEGAEWEIFAYGLRNPWRFSFDRETGDLFLGDVGQGAWEEVDYVAAGRGGEPFNFGWDVWEGRARYEEKAPNDAGTLVDPVHVYPLEDGNCSVVGGFVYRGGAAPALDGRYVFGDYCAGTVWTLEVRGGEARRVRREPIRIEGLTSFGEDEQGELYAVAHGGELLRLTGGS